MSEENKEFSPLEIKLKEAISVIEFYAKGQYGGYEHYEMPEGFRNEFGCGCCAGVVKNGSSDFDGEVIGLTAREYLQKWQLWEKDSTEKEANEFHDKSRSFKEKFRRF